MMMIYLSTLPLHPEWSQVRSVWLWAKTMGWSCKRVTWLHRPGHHVLKPFLGDQLGLPTAELLVKIMTHKWMFQCYSTCIPYSKTYMNMTNKPSGAPFLTTRAGDKSLKQQWRFSGQWIRNQQTGPRQGQGWYGFVRKRLTPNSDANFWVPIFGAKPYGTCQVTRHPLIYLFRLIDVVCLFVCAALFQTLFVCMGLGRDNNCWNNFQRDSVSKHIGACKFADKFW
jgi:hypothetical protein